MSQLNVRRTRSCVFSTIMFDCDGVLVDSEILISRIHSEELAKTGVTRTLEELLQRYCGVCDSEMLADIEREQGIALPADYEALVAKRVEEEYPKALTAIAGVDEALSIIPYDACVVSGSSVPRLAIALNAVDLSRFFGPNVFSAESLPNGKPAPDAYLYAAERMGVRPRACVVVEDSIAGVTAGVAAGMTVLGFDGGSHCLPGHAKRLYEAGARLVFSNMRELPEILRVGTGAR